MLLLMLLTSLGLAPEIREEAYAETSSSVMIGGPDSLKEGVNTENARLVHYGDRYWYVIGYDREGVAAGSGEITLLSRDSIKSTPFDKNYNAVYSSSNLKNDIEAYTNEKLSAGERSAIASRDLSAINARQQGDLKWWFENFRTVDEVLDNPVQGAMLWPLSAKEASAVNAGIRKTGTEYWLRTLGVPEYQERYWYDWEDFDVVVIPAAMATVWADGSVDIQAEKENTTYWKGMRPALKLKKNDIVMVSDATGGKESAEDGTLSDAGAITTKEVKLTLKDDAHKNFYVNPCDVESGEEGSLTVKYSSASTGENEYISAVIKGADGSIKQYGRIAQATAGPGTATIRNLPTDDSGKISLPEGDKLYVFNEQYNGDEKTDFASDLTEIRLTGHDWEFYELRYDIRAEQAIAEYHCSVCKNINEVEAEENRRTVAATCEEKNKEYRILNISADESPDGKAHSKSLLLREYGEPRGHDYKAFLGFRWTGDASAGYSNAEAIFGCTRDYSHVTYVNAVVTSKVQEPTCTAIGRTLYEANLSADKSPDGRDHGEAKYAKAKPRLGHDWGEPTYEWSDDNRTVTATRVCKRDESHVETETVETEITKTTKAPTCSATGVGDFKTKPFKNEAFTEKTKNGATIPVDPKAHQWNEGERQGDPNVCGGYVTIFTCNLCGANKEEITGGSDHDWTDYIVDVQPTCTEPGEKSRHCTKCPAHDLDGIETIDPTGHAWKFVDFTWTGNETGGYKMAVANYVCKNNSSHTMTVNAEISEEVIDPTCKARGKTVYTASVSASDSPDGTAHSDSMDAKTTATVPHEWKYTGSMVWTGNDTAGYTKAAAKYSCRFGCGQTAEVEAKITETEQTATCEKPGGTLYTAKVDESSRLTDEEVKDETKLAKEKEALGHKWHYKDMIWTGKEEDGFTKAVVKFTCENDENHVKLVDATITEEVIKPTCVEQGYTLYKASLKATESLTGYEVYDYNIAKIKKATGHAWQFKGFTWTAVDDKRGFTANADYVCRHDKSHTASVGADIRITEKTARCEEPGGTLYTASVNREYRLTDEAVTDEKLVKKAEPTGHKWGTPKYTWSRDNSTVTAESVCENDPRHVKKETVKTTSAVTKEATSGEAGIMTYTAVFTDPLFKTQTKEVSFEKPKPADPGRGGGANTGDGSALLSWLAVMLFAALALTIAALYRRKRS